MTPQQARRYVIGMVVISAVLVAIARVRGEESKVRIRLIIGAMVVLMVLSIVSEFAPSMAVAFAGIVAVSSAVTAREAVAGLAAGFTD